VTLICTVLTAAETRRTHLLQLLTEMRKICPWLTFDWAWGDAALCSRDLSGEFGWSITRDGPKENLNILTIVYLGHNITTMISCL
jgi:hypothetical protein